MAVALLLVQGPSLLHLLLVQHVTCEHGELIEVGGAAVVDDGGLTRPQRALPPPKPPVESASDQARVERAHRDSAGHEHCDALAVRHRLPDVGVSIAPSSLLPGTLLEVGGERVAASPVPLLALAPKSSPPC